ncbi:MAG: DUF3301 domain-containing protein [Gammaproteobacteria bacterium]
MPEHWLLLALCGLGGWVYFEGIRIREIALRAGRDYCRNIGVQLLDETVSRQSVGVGRDPSGTLRMRRAYAFEFTSDGERRYKGEITMLGSRVSGVVVELHRIVH